MFDFIGLVLFIYLFLCLMWDCSKIEPLRGVEDGRCMARVFEEFGVVGLVSDTNM